MPVRRIITFAMLCVAMCYCSSLAAGATFNSVEVPMAIVDNGTITSTLTVPAGACDVVTDVNVRLNLTHTFLPDLTISITHNGTGKGALLFDGSCDSDKNLIAVFDDEAATALQCPPIGAYQPLLPLSDLDGINGAGIWTLTVTDNVELDTGTLNSWGIDLVCGTGSPLLAVAINGNGSVNSVPGGIACTTGNSGSCSASFSSGEVVTLKPTEVSSVTLLSHFGGWSLGCDSINGNDCTVNMNADKNITATFVTNQPVYIPAVGYFPSLQAAYNAPGATGITIRAQAVDLAVPDFTLNSGKSVTLSGGFDSNYSANSGGYTVLTGVLTIQTGSLTVENLVIR